MSKSKLMSLYEAVERRKNHALEDLSKAIANHDGFTAEYQEGQSDALQLVMNMIDYRLKR